MALRVLGGETTSDRQRFAVNVVDTFSAAITVGQIVMFSTSSNMAINSAAISIGLGPLLRVESLNANSTIATVVPFAWHGPYEFSYNGAAAPTLGQTLQLSTVLTKVVKGSTNATVTSTNKCVSVGHVTGKCLGVLR